MSLSTVQPLTVLGLAVVAICNDNKARLVDLSGKQPKQVLGYLRHIQGGTLRLKDEPVELRQPERRIIVPK